jgi:hypothetical protein
MAQINYHPDQDSPFPVAADRFDQKNEMFKRAPWVPEIQPLASRFYREARYRISAGYQKLDYALRNASWNLEWGLPWEIPAATSAFMSGRACPKKFGILRDGWIC